MDFITRSIVLAIILILTVNGDEVKSEEELQKYWRKLSDGKIFLEIAEKQGLRAEEKEVITEDGYILSMFHIPGNKTRPLLLVHGNLPTADCWIIRGETSPAVLFASKGYDVWAINLRGTKYSRRHQHLDADLQPERFYNYSFYEQGIYDLPAAVDLVLSATGQQQLVAIGHSLGTTQMYVMGAERPEYNDKIKLAISLSPMCFLEHLRGLLGDISEYLPAFINLLKSLQIHELASHEQIAPLARAFCFNPIGNGLCRLGFSLVAGLDWESLESDFVIPLLEHFPGGSSVKLFTHLVQMIESKNFLKFDYGLEGNMAIYGSVKPPAFDLSKVTMKTALFVGREDPLGTVLDSQRLKSALPNVVNYTLLPYEKFSHVDFVWGRYMPEIFYPYLNKVMDQYT